MDRSQISPGLAKARAADIAKISFAAMKAMTAAELPLRLLTYDHFAAKSRRPGLDADLARGYRQLAVEALTTADRARAAKLMKTAGVAPSYDGAELERMCRAGTALRLADGHVVPAADARDLRYAITLAQGAIGRRTAEDSAAFRNFLQRRARALGVTLPPDWGRPAAPAVSPSTTRQNQPMPGNSPAGKSALAKSAPRSVTVDTPALDGLARSRSLEDGLTTLRRQGQLGQAAAELARVAAAADSLDGLSKAVSYRRKAAVVTDPLLRQGYLELATEAEQAAAR